MDIDLIIKELKFSASRSSGAGGQNVNKVSTKIELRFDLESTTLFTIDEKERIYKKLKNRISNEGILILTSESERTQLGNKKKAIELFLALMEKALVKPKKRIKTKPTKSSREKRLQDKKLVSEKKKLRNME